MLLIVGILVASLASVANGQVTPLYPNFPYCKCVKSPSAYSLSPTIKSLGGGQYCFTLSAKVPPGCTSYCCSRADLKKVEIDVRPACDVSNAVIKATVNGVPTKVGAGLYEAPDGPPGATILRLTQLGLGLGSDGAEICITLGLNKNGQGCTTLEQLCVPPPGLPAGVCSTALFDSQNDCCPVDTPGVPSPPPPPPLSPSPLPSPPSCRACVYLNLTPNNPPFPYEFTAAQCTSYTNSIIADVTTQAGAVGARLLPGSAAVSCGPVVIKVCFSFFSDEDGALLQPFIDTQVVFWRQLVTGPGDCPAFLNGYTVTALVGGDGSDLNNLPPSCLHGISTQGCQPADVDFPKCKCVTRPLTTPFALRPAVTTLPGRTNKTTLYCFTLAVVVPIRTNAVCADTTSLLKVEFYADDNQRRRITGIGLQPAGSPAMKFISTSWGSIGEQTLKATPLNWSKAQADGATICLELDNSTTLSSFCYTNSNTCWANLFDDTKNCCPLYSASF
ncbi:hypothetical protein GPECTOR_14phG2b [Gonium pectorale]|uniref:Pherophorin domain-containing protein n=1 Tax=Gonium pectorale TaxID=33097 RepID=A0A150GMV2_GONPE|nr:hypothetical protein GPECTOR_14phG2b [Gonium pectorale]|eukprot:KXZ51121.1 hypothetical protein GPECTOR_14phG2b [Gonium pectorale]